jgi:hypothetical protein
MPAGSLSVLCALTHRENLLLNPNADGGLSSARLAATPKRLPILPLDARKCNAIFTSSLQISYKVSSPAIFGGPSHTG